MTWIPVRPVFVLRSLHLLSRVVCLTYLTSRILLSLLGFLTMDSKISLPQNWTWDSTISLQTLQLWPSPGPAMDVWHCPQGDNTNTALIIRAKKPRSRLNWRAHLARPMHFNGDRSQRRKHLCATETRESSLEIFHFSHLFVYLLLSSFFMV